MRAGTARLVIPFVLCSIGASAVQAQSSPTTQFTIGAKVWDAAWLSYVPATYSGVSAAGQGVFADSLNAVEGERRTSVLPQLFVRHGAYFASASYGRFSSDFHVQASPLVLPTGQTLIGSRTDYLKRRESDINIGYMVTPEVGLAIGYKDATETRDLSFGGAPQRTALLSTRVRGLLLGAAGNFAVYQKLRMYAQAAYGPARFKADFYDRGAILKTHGRYLIGELGLNYPVFMSASGTVATAAIGYRTQTVRTDSFDTVFLEKHELRDVRDGLVLSLSVTL